MFSGLSIHLFPYFMYASRDGASEIMHLCRLV